MMNDETETKLKILALAAATCILLYLSACGFKDYLSKDDNAAEEITETVIEDGLEHLLGLENDELKDTIDLSRNSPEKD